MKRMLTKLPRLSVVLAVLFVTLPLAAFAATWVAVDEVEYTEAASGSGSGGGSWSWDGADDMTLTDFQGSSLSVEGPLTITCEGNNQIDNYLETADVTLVGADDDASLTLGTGGEDNFWGHVYGDLEVESLDLDIDNGYIIVEDTLTIEDSEVDGTAEGSVIRMYGRMNGAGEFNPVGAELKLPLLTIRNSHVHLVNTNSQYVEETFDPLTQTYLQNAPLTVSIQCLGSEMLSDPDLDLNSLFVFENVEGDTVPYTNLGREGESKMFYVAFGTEDSTPKMDMLIDPIPEPEEEKQAEETVTPATTAAAPATVLPATADASAVAELIAASAGAVLALGSALSIRRKQY